MAGEWGWDFTPANLEPQLGRPEVGFWKGTGENISEGLASTVPGLAMRHLKTMIGAKISKDEFEQSVYPSKGVTWNNRMTWAEADAAYQARVDKEVYDDVASRMTTGGKVGSVAGSFVGGALDPINLLPIGAINISRGFAYNVAKTGAMLAAQEAAIVAPLEMTVKSQEQMPTGGYTHYLTSVALSAAIGGVFGALGHGFKAMAENRGLRLGELGELNKPTVDPALVQAAPIDPLRTPAEAPTSVVQGPATPSTSAATPSAPKARAERPVVTPVDNRPTDIAIRFPDAEHKRLYNADPNKPDDLAWLASNGLTVDDYAAYRNAVDRRLNNQREAITKNALAPRDVPAPMLSSVNLSHTHQRFTDADLADNISRRFNVIPDEMKPTATEVRDKIVGEELVARAKQLAAETGRNAPVPSTMPTEGVLDQSWTTKKSGGKRELVGADLKEMPLDEWYRRQLSPDFTGKLTGVEGRRADWEGTMANRLQRLTPEQLDYTLFHLMNKSDVEAMAKHFGIENGDLTAKTRAVQEAIQPRGQQVRETTNRVADRAIDNVLNDRVQEAHARIDAEAKAVNTADAQDALSGIANIKTGADAVSFFSKEFGGLEMAKLREASPEAAALVERISRLDKKQDAVLRTMACLLGAK